MTDEMSPKWNLDTLEIYLSSRILALKEAIVVAMTASQNAIAKAENAVEKRFDAVNEFRETLSDQANTFMPRQEYQVQHTAVLEKIDLLTARVAKIETEKTTQKEGMGVTGAIILGAFSVLSGIAIIVGAFAAFIK